MRNTFFTFLTFFFINICSSQDKKSNFKKIVETTSKIEANDNIKNHISEVEETEYNRKGKKTKSKRQTFLSNEPYEAIITTFFYNTKDQVIYEENLIVNDSSRYNMNYTYHENKLIKKFFNYTNDKRVYIFNETFLYNNKNKLTKSYYSYQQKLLNSEKHEFYIKMQEFYNNKGQTIEMDYTKSDSTYKNNRYKYKWNSKRLCTKKYEYNIYNELINIKKYKYTFNKSKHWTLKKTYIDKILVEITYREIEYYN